MSDWVSHVLNQTTHPASETSSNVNINLQHTYGTWWSNQLRRPPCWVTLRFSSETMLYSPKLQTTLFAIAVVSATSFQTNGAFRKPAVSLNLNHENSNGEDMGDRRHFMKNLVSGVGIASLVSSSTLGSPSPAFAEDESLVDVYYGVGKYISLIWNQFIQVSFELCTNLWFLKPNNLQDVTGIYSMNLLKLRESFWVEVIRTSRAVLVMQEEHQQTKKAE